MYKDLIKWLFISVLFIVAKKKKRKYSEFLLRESLNKLYVHAMYYFIYIQKDKLGLYQMT